MEKPTRYTRNIYYVEQDQLYVNLFIASQLEIGNGDIKVIQNTSFPESDKTDDVTF
ncbi:beta-L-arabinofuranosidase domain-containing protein [Novibacillus thermophilus]|uniref:beta-L-arabinofuranosidase domain-containing protein n=1 Tax=Novibacillus thermophilus TaxID=1471761 RepID=UPI0011EA5B3D